MRKIRKYKKTNVGAGTAALAAARKSLTERFQLQVDQLNYTRFADAFVVGRTWVRLQRLPDGEDWVARERLVDEHPGDAHHRGTAVVALSVELPGPPEDELVFADLSAVSLKNKLQCWRLSPPA